MASVLGDRSTKALEARGKFGGALRLHNVLMVHALWPFLDASGGARSPSQRAGVFGRTMRHRSRLMWRLGARSVSWFRWVGSAGQVIGLARSVHGAVLLWHSKSGLGWGRRRHVRGWGRAAAGSAGSARSGFRRLEAYQLRAGGML